MGSEGTVGRQKEDRQNQNNVQLKGKYFMCLCVAQSTFFGRVLASEDRKEARVDSDF